MSPIRADRSRFTSKFSTTASMTRSRSEKDSRSVAKVSFRSALSRPASSTLPRSIAAFDLSASSSVISTTTTPTPALERTSAIPPPICPPPTIPTLLMPMPILRVASSKDGCTDPIPGRHNTPAGYGSPIRWASSSVLMTPGTQPNTSSRSRSGISSVVWRADRIRSNRKMRPASRSRHQPIRYHASDRW